MINIHGADIGPIIIDHFSLSFLKQGCLGFHIVDIFSLEKRTFKKLQTFAGLIVHSILVCLLYK